MLWFIEIGSMLFKRFLIPVTRFPSFKWIESLNSLRVSGRNGKTSLILTPACHLASGGSTWTGRRESEANAFVSAVGLIQKKKKIYEEENLGIPPENPSRWSHFSFWFLHFFRSFFRQRPIMKAAAEFALTHFLLAFFFLLFLLPFYFHLYKYIYLCYFPFLPVKWERWTRQNESAKKKSNNRFIHLAQGRCHGNGQSPRRGHGNALPWHPWPPFTIQR